MRKEIELKLLITLLIFNFSSMAYAGVDTSNGAWLGTFTKKSIGDKSFLWAETQLRYNLSAGEMGQLLYRFGPLIKINKFNFEFGALYGYIQNNNSKEHRYTLQHSKNYDLFEHWSLSTRTRIEYRVRENIADTSQRFRILARLSKSLSSKSLFVLWDEVFVNIKKNTWGGETMDRNRFFIGLRNIKKNHNIEYGYLNQYVTNSDQKSMGHILVVYFNF